MKYLLVILIFSLQFGFKTASGMLKITPDYAKEQRIFVQIEDSLLDGEIVQITGADKKFIGILTESENTSKKAAIVIHGLGAHPNWATVIRPLRVSLTTQNYHTLSIQVPVLANDKDLEQYLKLLAISDKRITASIQFLQKQGYMVDLLVAHSLGTTMASHFLANNKHTFSAFVGVGMPTTTTQYLSKINIAILDVYGDEDIKSVLASVNERASHSKHNKKYTQLMLTGNHFFTDNEDSLIAAVHKWLK